MVSTRRQLIQKVVAGLFLAAVVAIAIEQIWTRRVALGQALGSLPIIVLVSSLVAAGAGVFATMLSWRAVLASLGVRLPLGAASRIFFLGQLGKYLPGSVWPIVAQAELARRTGTARAVTVAANLIALVTGLAVGLVVGAALVPFTSPHVFHRFWWVLLALPFLLIPLYPPALNALVSRVLRLTRQPPLESPVRAKELMRAIAWSAVSWLVLGVHIGLMTAALHHHFTASVLLASAGGVALATCAGVLFIPAPAGAGIREAVLVLALASVLTTNQALSIALLSRVMLIIVDFTLAGSQIGMAAVRRRRHRGMDEQNATSPQHSAAAPPT